MTKAARKSRTGNMVLYLSLMLFSMCLTSISPVIAFIQQDMPALNAGLVVTLNFVGFICVASLAGALASRVSKKTFITAALLVYALVLPLFLLRLPQDLFYVLFFLVGGCNGIIETQSSASLADNNPEDADRYVNRGHIFFGFGAIVSPLAIALLLTAGVSYAWYYLALALFSAVLFIRFLRVPLVSVAAPVRLLHSLKSLRKEPLFVLIGLALFFYTGAEVASWAWLSSQLQFRHNFTPLMSGVAVSVFWLSMTLGRGVCEKLERRMRLSTLMIGIGLISGLMAFLMHFVSSFASAAVMAVLLGTAFSSQFPFLATYGVRQTTLPSGLAFSLLMILANLGSSVMAYVVHAVRVQSNLGADLVLTFSLLMVPLLVYIVRRKTET